MKTKKKLQRELDKINKKLIEARFEIRKVKTKLKIDDGMNVTREGKHLYHVKGSTIIIQINPSNIPFRPFTTPELGEAASKNGQWSLSKCGTFDKYFSSVAFFSGSCLSPKQAPKIKSWFYYEVSDGNHTFFSNKFQ